MDATGVVLTLAIVAAKLAVKAKAFKTRMKTRQTLLDGLIRYCEMVGQDAKLIEAELKAEQRQINPHADLEEDPWHILLMRVAEMKRLLIDFDTELGDLTHHSATTLLGRTIVQIKTDDSIPRIKQIQEEIVQQYHSLSICVPFALHRRKSSTPSIPPQPLSPPPTPSYDIPNKPCRKGSDASTLYGSPRSDIETATRNLDISTVERLLSEDTSGELKNTIDSVGRTLVDIAICCGNPTHRSQVPLVKMLMGEGVEFTQNKNLRCYKTYTDIVKTIKHQNRTRR